MRKVQVSSVKTHISRLLDEVEHGETIVVTRHGRTIARIVPEGDVDRERFAQAKEDLTRLRKAMPPMTIEEIVSARDEGRRG